MASQQHDNSTSHTAREGRHSDLMVARGADAQIGSTWS
jgi:hypothetical protein